MSANTTSRLTAAQRKRLLEHCSGGFRDLIEAGMLTGARYGELRTALVSDYDKAARVLSIRKGKTGPRTVPLSNAAAQLFDRLRKAKLPGAYLLTRDDGQPWQHSDQGARPMVSALLIGLDIRSILSELSHMRGNEFIRKVQRYAGSPSAKFEKDSPMFRFTYPAKLTADRKDGGYVVTFRDLPEAITQGESIADALSEAEGALQAAIEGRLEDDMDIPAPSQPKRGERQVVTPVTTALKAAVFIAMREQRLSKSELARRMNVDEKEARRLLDPRHPSKVATLERALAALGRRAEIQVI